MIQIQLKAKHFYYIVYYLRDSRIVEYYSLINRIKTALNGNVDDESIFSIDVQHYEVSTIFRILTNLSEGQSATINAEMLEMLQPQIINGVRNEMMNGLIINQAGELPENAYWQILAKTITFIREQNISLRDSAIRMGKEFINKL